MMARGPADIMKGIITTTKACAGTVGTISAETSRSRRETSKSPRAARPKGISRSRRKTNRSIQRIKESKRRL